MSTTMPARPTLDAGTADRPARPKLKRSLGLSMATALVVGNMVGSGVFGLPSALAAYGPDLAARLGVHGRRRNPAGAGVREPRSSLSAAPAGRMPTRASPSATSPDSGRRGATGSPPGPATPPSRSSSSATPACSGPVSPRTTSSPSRSGSSVIWVLTLLNIAGVRESGVMQVVTTVLKFVPLLLIGVIGLFYITPPTSLPSTRTTAAWWATCTPSRSRPR